MTSCNKIRPLISEYVDDTLDARRLAFVDSHLASCPDCRRMADDFRANKSVMSSMPLRQTSSAFDSALAQRIAAINDQRAKRSWLDRLADALRPSRTNVWRPAFATMSALAVVGMSVVFLTPTPIVPRQTAPSVTDTALIQQCVVQHRSYAEAQPLGDFSAQTLAQQYDGDGDADDAL